MTRLILLRYASYKELQVRATKCEEYLQNLHSKNLNRFNVANTR